MRDCHSPNEIRLQSGLRDDTLTITESSINTKNCVFPRAGTIRLEAEVVDLYRNPAREHLDNVNFWAGAFFVVWGGCSLTAHLLSSASSALTSIANYSLVIGILVGAYSLLLEYCPGISDWDFEVRQMKLAVTLTYEGRSEHFVWGEWIFSYHTPCRPDYHDFISSKMRELLNAQTALKGAFRKEIDLSPSGR